MTKPREQYEGQKYDWDEPLTMEQQFIVKTCHQEHGGDKDLMMFEFGADDGRGDRVRYKFESWKNEEVERKRLEADSEFAWPSGPKKVTNSIKETKTNHNDDIKITFKTSSLIRASLKILAAPKNASLESIINQAISDYLKKHEGD